MKTPNRAITYGIIGMGKVGSYFYHLLTHKQASCTWVVSSHFQACQKTLVYKNTHSIDFSCNIILLCVPDDQIVSISQSIPQHIREHALVLHTSGTHSYHAIHQSVARRGVLYPLQTFGVQSPEFYKQSLPYVIDAEQTSDLGLLHQIVEDLGGKSYLLTPEQKSALHLSAVFANNFTHHILGHALDILRQKDIPTDIMIPLLKQTLDNAWHAENTERQTGPARRNDTETIHKHQKELSLSQPEKLELYNLLTQYIQQKK